MDEARMTCRAGIRVLYELAGASQATWEGVARDCRMSLSAVKRIFARNDNWPHGFGALDYCDLVSDYSKEYAAPYTALNIATDTLREYGAFTPAVAAAVEGVGQSSSEEEVEACLRRLSDVIFTTARPNTRAAAGNVRDAGAGPAPVVGNERDEKKRAEESELAREGRDLTAPGVPAPTSPTPAPGVPAPASPTPGTPAPASTFTSASGASQGHAPVSPSPAPAEPAALTFDALFRALVEPEPPALLLTCTSGTELARALLPRDVAEGLAASGRLAACASGALESAERRTLATRLSADGGVRLRETLARCREALADADAAAAHTAMRSLARVAAARAGADAPDALRDPLGFTAARVDGSPAAQLLALALVALLGGPMAARVLTRAARERLRLR